MLHTDGMATAKNVLNLVSIFDITGTTSVMEAFLHPTCLTYTGFPKVTPLYNR
jgi:hypothetical protein